MSALNTRRTALLTVAVALLVVLAGCSGGGSTATPTPAPNPTTTPQSTPTASSSSQPVSLPPGWTETGVNDTDAALRAHYTAVLRGPATRVTYESRVAEGEPKRNTSLEMELDPASNRLYASVDGKESHREAYYADGTLTQWSVENETVVGESEVSFVRASQLADYQVLKSQLLTYTLALDRTVERGGTTAFVYEVTGVHDDTLSGAFGGAQSASGTIVVSETGRILELETTVTYAKATVTYRYTHQGLNGTDVTTPSWYRQA